MTIPAAFQGTTPTITEGGLSPLQLALANYLIQGVTIPFFINQGFIDSAKTFTTTSIVPAPFGATYTSSGDNIYLVRPAPDCGPDETNRFDRILVGTRANIAPDSYAYYGPVIYGGTGSQGSI